MTDDRIAKKMRELELRFGERATLVIKRRGKTYITPVTVVSVGFNIPKDKRAEVTVINVTVRSESGGEILVSPSELRHGSVLDRISLELDRAEVEDV